MIVQFKSKSVERGKKAYLKAFFPNTQDLHRSKISDLVNISLTDSNQDPLHVIEECCEKCNKPVIKIPTTSFRFDTKGYCHFWIFIHYTRSHSNKLHHNAKTNSKSEKQKFYLCFEMKNNDKIPRYLIEIPFKRHHFGAAEILLSLKKAHIKSSSSLLQQKPIQGNSSDANVDPLNQE